MISTEKRFQNLKSDRAEKSFLNEFGIFIFIFAIWLGFENARRKFMSYKITLAAGKNQFISSIKTLVYLLEMNFFQ